MTPIPTNVPPLVFVDTETDSLQPGRRIWDVAIIRREPTGERGEYQRFLPVDLSSADPFSLQIGGFWARHPLGRWIAGHDPNSHPPSVWEVPNYDDERSVAVELARATHGAHWVGLVPGFDTEIIASLLRRHGLVPSWHHHVIDAEVFAAGYLSGRNAAAADYAALHGSEQLPAASAGAGPPWRSDDLSRECGVEPPPEGERHSALGDARWTERWYDRIVGADRALAA